VAVSKDG